MSTQRELKFRQLFEYGQDAEHPNGKKWIETTLGSDGVFRGGGFVCWSRAVSPVLQYTGLRDRNGREIYEGDVIMHGTGRLRGAGVVRWYEYGAGFKVFRGHDHYEQYDSEVIGNIYENPELIPA